jgi:hypothetical protein
MRVERLDVVLDAEAHLAVDSLRGTNDSMSLSRIGGVIGRRGGEL